MQIIDSKSTLRLALKNRINIGLVPTMGNLHAGHIQLVKLAKQHAECVVVSIFVNPLQFGANEDLASYPRTLAADCEKLEAAGADIVFTPSMAELYPNFDGIHLNQNITVNLPDIANILCGVSRPGHFAGVATIVTKLFNIVQPQIALFGKKDFQQLFIIRELVKQLNYPIEIIAGETVREISGLALSSRNGYLSETARANASQLNKALQVIINAIENGNTHFDALEKQTALELAAHGWLVDYISVRAVETLLPAKPNDKNLVVLGAAKIESTRLIDNIEFCAK
ncbi:pantoate--beta-alanine ligase [Methylotenera versatilis]|uniref:pantoate--beta-alanine ligase n=1 Tax=Methylotenera versatilis TaxID=1055487 RepID=UPI000648C220|nr:pantoate--beta-alanine ligase [Methylotenera versatilis]